MNPKNVVVLAGNVSTDVTYKANGSRSSASFNLAVNRVPYKNKDGDMVKDADFIRIVVWGDKASSVDKNVEKGKGIMVTGELRVRKYEKDDGTSQTITEVVADGWCYTPSSGGDGGNGGGSRGGRDRDRDRDNDRDRGSSRDSRERDRDRDRDSRGDRDRDRDRGGKDGDRDRDRDNGDGDYDDYRKPAKPAASKSEKSAVKKSVPPSEDEFDIEGGEGDDILIDD